MWFLIPEDDTLLNYPMNHRQVLQLTNKRDDKVFSVNQRKSSAQGQTFSVPFALI
jgi:hypothetical protein